MKITDRRARAHARSLAQNWLAMKLTIVLLTLALFQVNARGVAQKVNYSAKNVKLEKLLNVIEQQTGYVFIYRALDVADAKPITVELKDASVEMALRESLKDQPFRFIIQGNTVSISKTASHLPGNETTIPNENAPPPITVHGRITNENGEPVVGVTISIKGDKAIGSTDGKGEFTVTNVPDNATLVFSALTIETIETKLNGRTELTLQAKIKVSQLEDVVVSKGYYSVKQRENTGSVSIVKGEDITKQPVSNPIMALEGRVPGLFIQQSSGVIGANQIIRLRGQNSIANGNDPLFIVDGLPFTSSTLTGSAVTRSAVGLSGPGQGLSPFNILNPSDIERIEVLKDADATAIYGSRGANGVILITTKKGKKEQTGFIANIEQGISRIAKKIDLLNTQQYLQLRREGFINDGKNPTASDFDVNGAWGDTTRYTDWQKEMIGGTAQYLNAQASISGGNSNTQFRVGAGFTRQTQVYPGEYPDQKISAQASINHTSADQRFHILFSSQYGHDNNVVPFTDFMANILLAPNAPALYNPDGSLNWQLSPSGASTWVNPLASTLRRSISVTDNIMGSLSMDYELLGGLVLKTSLGYTHQQMNQSAQTPATAFYPLNGNNRSNSIGTTNLTTWIIEPQVTYTRKIFTGRLDIIAGGTIQKNVQNSTAFSVSGFSNDYQIPNIAAATSVTLSGNTYSEYKYNGIFSRISYLLNEKYILNLTARRDGSSRFGPGNQYGNFGAVGAGWIFSKEKFVQEHLPFISFGKIRTSYGSTGNDQITDYQYLSSYSSYSTPYLNTIGLVPARIANPYFAWERNNKFEIALELGLLRDRISFNINYYRNRTANQLISQPLPSMDGFTSILANLPAVIQNAGVELEINTTNIKTKAFSWSSNFNVTVPRNKLISFENFSNSSYRNLYVLGRSLYVKRLYVYTGIDPQTGLFTVQDYNKDGIINTSDLQFAKEISQSAFGGFSNNFTYKKWQLDVFIQFVKQTGYDYTNYFQTPGFFNKNQPVAALSHWTVPNPNESNFQKITQGGSTSIVNALSNMLTSDNIITDASYIRMKNISLSYLIQPATSRYFKNLRFYLNAQNLFTITKYRVLDPGVPGLVLPPMRTIIAGISLGL